MSEAIKEEEQTGSLEVGFHKGKLEMNYVGDISAFGMVYLMATLVRDINKQFGISKQDILRKVDEISEAKAFEDNPTMRASVSEVTASFSD